jgi:hypothetical protein
MSALTHALEEGGEQGVLSNLGLRNDGQRLGESPIAALIAALIAEAERRKNEHD